MTEPRDELAALVAEQKGLPTALAKRLHGTTRAELEADADDLATALHGERPRGRPRVNLRPTYPADTSDEALIDNAMGRIRRGRYG